MDKTRQDNYKVLIIPFVIVLAVLLILFKKDYLVVLNLSLFNNTIYNNEANYQVATLVLAFLVLIISYILNPKNFKKFLRWGKINASIKPVKYLGINPDENENWYHLGRNFAVIISLVTLIVIYFQIVYQQSIQFNIGIIPIVLLFAISNSFVEEIIFRFSLVSVLFDSLPHKYIYLLSGFIFGIGHYFGVPGQIPGVLMAGFIGWFLAKSIGETKGIFWAWFIHFLQDVIIFIGLFISA